MAGVVARLGDAVTHRAAPHFAVRLPGGCESAVVTLTGTFVAILVFDRHRRRIRLRAVDTFSRRGSADRYALKTLSGPLGDPALAAECADDDACYWSSDDESAPEPPAKLAPPVYRGDGEDEAADWSAIRALCL